MHHTFPCNRLISNSHPPHPHHTHTSRHLPPWGRTARQWDRLYIHSHYQCTNNGQSSLLPTETFCFFSWERRARRSRDRSHTSYSYTLILYLTLSAFNPPLPACIFTPPPQLPRATQSIDNPPPLVNPSAFVLTLLFNLYYLYTFLSLTTLARRVSDFTNLFSFWVYPCQPYKLLFRPF